MSDAGREARKVFGVWSLGVFTFSFLANVNTTPELAGFGLGSVTVILLAIVLFLVPTAMASAELGSAWPRTGGIYVWTTQAFGERWGFLVIWIEWASFVVAWPGIMGTITLQAAFVVDPALQDNGVFLSVVIIAVTWLAAGLTLHGLRLAKGLTWFAVIGGVVVPTLIVVGLALAYVAAGRPVQMATDLGSLVPTFHAGDLAFLSGALLMFMGIEISAIHAGDVRDPGRTIPRANLVAVALCVVLFVPLTLALATVLPRTDINIITGLMQATQRFLVEFGAAGLVPAVAALLVLGLAASLVQILGGPSRGLLVAARQGGHLPPMLQRTNAAGMPVAIILLQAAVSSVLALGYHLLGTVQNAWFMFSLVQTNMSLVLYLIMLAAVIRLRRSQPHVRRPYRIPGRGIGLLAVCGTGGLVCLLGLGLSLIPTDEAAGLPLWLYELVLIAATVGFAGLPFLFHPFRKPSWQEDRSLLPK
jgi:amino acid transporter